MTKYYDRWQNDVVALMRQQRRVLLLLGARQSGKSSFAEKLMSVDDEIDYVTLDDIEMQEAARLDPKSFIQRRGEMLIIDEIQHVPELLLAIKRQVDQDKTKGQYLLTGSTNINSMPTVKESLAGRVSKIRLRSLSQGEIVGVRPRFLEKAFCEKFALPGVAHDRDAIIKLAGRGGYPEVLALDEKGVRRWHIDYIGALLDRDLKLISNIYRQEAVDELIRVLAAWSGKYLDVAKIGKKLSIQRPTIESYINLIEAIFIVDRILPWTKTDYARVGKQKKIMMNDSGLMASLIGFKVQEDRLNADKVGKLIETFVYNELAIAVDVASPDYKIYHYRDRESREIDFIIERSDGAILGIEVKSGSVVSAEDFKHMNWFNSNIVKDRKFIGVVLYTGERVASFGDGMWVVPITSLWGE